jgi:GPH family glycoside/pentoside/hexuronide:cation symporter
VLEHVLEAHDPAIHMAAFVANALSAISSYPFWTWLAKKHGKPAAFRAGLMLSSVAFVSVFFVGPGDLALLFAVMVFSGAANVGFWMLLSALSADVTDLDQLESGERREGLFAGLSTLLKKGAFAAAAAGVGVGLTIVGYEENAAPSPETVFGLRLLFAVPPTILLFAALFVFRRFPLTRAKHAEVVAQLETSLATARA